VRQLWERRTETWCPWVYVAASDLRSIANRGKTVYIYILMGCKLDLACYGYYCRMERDIWMEMKGSHRALSEGK